jgi:hypothetical protein
MPSTAMPSTAIVAAAQRSHETAPPPGDATIAATAGRATIPPRLRPFAEPTLLPGESRPDYELIRQLLIDDIVPRTNLEWLLTFDLVELSWEILRYRRLKHRVLEAHRERAIAAILQHIDGAGLPDHAAPTVTLHSRRTAAQWRDDPAAAADIEHRLLASGCDATTINTETFLQAREAFTTFDLLLQSAQHRRIVLLRELNAQRKPNPRP